MLNEYISLNVRSPHDEHDNVPNEFTHKLVIGPERNIKD